MLLKINDGMPHDFRTIKYLKWSFQNGLRLHQNKTFRSTESMPLINFYRGKTYNQKTKLEGGSSLTQGTK